MELNREKLRVIVYYCWKRQMNSPAICKEVNDILGYGTISVRTCQNLVNQFSCGNFNLNDAEHPGRPVLDIDEDIQRLLHEDPHHSCRSLAFELGTSPQTVNSHLRAMGKRYLKTRWIPHPLSDENKAVRVRICEELLLMHRSMQFLRQLVTMDEIWIYWDTENVGHQGRTWRGDNDEPVVHPKPRPNRKHMLSIFWDHRGILLMEVLPKNMTVNADYYCSLLDRLVFSIRDKRRRVKSPIGLNLYYQHDNARPHVARKTVAKLDELGFKVLLHPPYSPDLAPSDFYLFGPLKSALRGKKYVCVEDIQRDITAWLDSKSTDFFDAAFAKLPKRWQKCINHDGDYFSHLSDND